MADSFGPVYEVTHTLEREIVADFDAWLSEHAEEMLSVQGIRRATVYAADDDDEGRPRRVSHYHFESDEDLENYLSGPAATMRLAATTLLVNDSVCRDACCISPTSSKMKLNRSDVPELRDNADWPVLW